MQPSYVRQYLDLWHHHWWWRARHHLVLRQLEDLTGRSTAGRRRLRILDVGCCGGVAFDDWSRFGEVWGVEPDERLAASTPKWSHRVTRASLADFRAPGETFDLILLLDVLEHIEDDAGALDRLTELLAPGGLLLVTVPALMLLWSAHDEANAHFRRYRKSALVARLRQAGLEPVDARYFFTWSCGLLLLRRFFARAEGYRVRVPWRPIGLLFEGLSRVEDRVFRALGLSPPFGSSLIAVAERPSRP